MAADGRQVERALAGTALDGAPVRELQVPGEASVAVAVAVDLGSGLKSDAILAAWRVLRERVGELGRWPVVMSSWSGEALTDDALAAWSVPPSALAAQARELSPAEALARFGADDAWWWEHDWRGWVEQRLGATRHRFGDAPDAREILDRAQKPTLAELDAWLLAWEEARWPTAEPDAGWHLEWFDDLSGDELAVVLLPTPDPADAGVYVSYFGAESEGAAVGLAALLRSWHERHGAELVASWGTMLQFVVAWPPQTLDEAFALAVEQDRVAGSLLGPAGVELRDHARALLRRETWFLHDRP